MSNLAPHVAAALKLLRHDAGLSQNELQRRSGVPKERISRYENGHVIPTMDVLEKLARGIGVRPSELIEIAEESAQWIP